MVTVPASGPFEVTVVDDFSAVADAVGVQVVRCEAFGDPSIALDCARRLRVQQIDGWVVIRGGDLGPTLCDLGPTGVPLIAVGPSGPPCAAAAVLPDQFTAGVLLGTELARRVAVDGDCGSTTFLVVGNGRTDPGPTGDPRAGIRAGLGRSCPTAAGQLVLIDAATDGPGFEQARATVTAAAPGTPIVIAATASDSAAAVLDVIASDRPGVLIAAIDDDPLAQCRHLGDSRWVGGVDAGADRQAQATLTVLSAQVRGEPTAPVVAVDPQWTSWSTPAGSPVASVECPGS